MVARGWHILENSRVLSLVALVKAPRKMPEKFAFQ